MDATLKIAGVYSAYPWGYAGMPVTLYRVTANGSRFGLRSVRGVLATADNREELIDYARQDLWRITYAPEPCQEASA